jgi:hypothetical protein
MVAASAGAEGTEPTGDPSRVGVRALGDAAVAAAVGTEETESTVDPSRVGGAKGAGIAGVAVSAGAEEIERTVAPAKEAAIRGPPFSVEVFIPRPGADPHPLDVDPGFPDGVRSPQPRHPEPPPPQLDADPQPKASPSQPSTGPVSILQPVDPHSPSVCNHPGGRPGFEVDVVPRFGIPSAAPCLKAGPLGAQVGSDGVDGPLRSDDVF